MIAIQVVASVSGAAGVEPARLCWGFHQFEAVPRAGELIRVWHDDYLEELTVVRVEHNAVQDRPTPEDESGVPPADQVAAFTRVVAEWLNE